MRRPILSKIEALLGEYDGIFPATMHEGHYPIVYMDCFNSMLCAECAEKNYNDPDEPVEFRPRDYMVITDTQQYIRCEECWTFITEPGQTVS